MNVFSLVLISYFGQNFIFFYPKVSNFQKNKILIKNGEQTFPRCLFLHGFDNFLKHFVQKYFYPFWKKMDQKHHFLNHFWQSFDAILEDVPVAKTIV